MKSVIITGASRGIGFETALAFGRAGYRVFATMRSPETATVLKQILKDESLAITIMAMDVNSDDSVNQCMNAIFELNGVVDVLVNNAGIERHGSVEELEMADFKAVMETNYFGVLRCTKNVLPLMRNLRKGCIINVASIAGKISRSPMAAYASSKFALEALSEALAQELKSHNIRVAIVEPGIIETDMAREIVSGGKSIYPHVKRLSELFAEALRTPTQASMVADKILEIAESESWQLRHPVGPDAKPFLDLRASLTDEEWVNRNALNDEKSYNAVERDFRVNARKSK